MLACPLSHSEEEDEEGGGGAVVRGQIAEGLEVHAVALGLEVVVDPLGPAGLSVEASVAGRLKKQNKKKKNATATAESMLLSSPGRAAGLRNLPEHLAARPTPSQENCED